MTYVLFFLALAGLAFCFYMMHRNTQVAGFRRDLVDFVFNAPGKFQRVNGVLEWRRRYDWFNRQAQYDDMLYRFWVWPLDRLVTGEYAETFFAWRAAGRPVVDDVEVKAADPTDKA